MSKKSVFGPNGTWTNEANIVEAMIRPACEKALFDCKDQGYNIRVAIFVAGIAAAPQGDFGLNIDPLEFQAIWQQTVNDIGLETLLDGRGF